MEFSQAPPLPPEIVFSHISLKQRFPTFHYTTSSFCSLPIFSSL